MNTRLAFIAATLCLLVVSLPLYSTDPDASSIAGVYVVYSTDRDDVGRAVILPSIADQADTFQITWELLGAGDPYSGVGIQIGNILSAAWFGGVVVYKVKTDGEAIRLVGDYVEFETAGEKHNETLMRIRKFDAEEIAERLKSIETAEEAKFQKGEIVAANYSADESWYYAEIIEVIPGKTGESYMVRYLDEEGDTEPELLSANNIRRHKVQVDDTVYAILDGGEQGLYYPLSVTEVPANWERLSKGDRVTLEDSQGTKYERELRHLMVEIDD